MFNILTDGISILNSSKYGIVVFYITAIGMGYFTVKQVINREINTKVSLPLYICIGSITLCVACYALFLLAYFWHWVLQPGSYLIFFFSIFVLIRGLLTGDIKLGWDIYLICIGLIVFLLLIVRLSFLKHIILPSYSDSTIHYQIVYGFLHPELDSTSNLSFGNVFRNYYHFGFHALAAWLTLITKIDAVNTISLLGQLFLVTVPLSVLLLVYTLTNNVNGALFAGLLAAIGWDMPAFAVNWGKFPALISLALLPAFIAFLILYIRDGTKNSRAVYWGMILVIGLVLVHTRIVICLALVLIGFFLSSKLIRKNEIEFPQSVRLSLLYVFCLWPISQLIANFYLRFPLWIVFLLLLPYAFQNYPKVSVGIFFFTAGMWLVTLFPQIVYKNDQMLLDRQFLEIVLYIPFSVMGGTGFEGTIRKLSFNQTSRWIVAGILVGCVIFNSRNSASLLPDSCCNYFQESDRYAFQWLQENASDDSLVIISSFDDGDKIFGTDAGIWIYPLVGLNTNKLPFNTIWHLPNVIKEICKIGTQETYVYMGGRQYSFNNVQLVQQKWIELVYKSGGTEIYQVSKCL